MTCFDRYARAERDLKQARPFGEGAKKFYEAADIKPAPDNNKELVVAMTSDRGKSHFLFSNEKNVKITHFCYLRFMWSMPHWCCKSHS